MKKMITDNAALILGANPHDGTSYTMAAPPKSHRQNANNTFANCSFHKKVVKNITKKVLPEAIVGIISLNHCWPP